MSIPAYEIDLDGTRRRIETERALAAAHAGASVVLQGGLIELACLDRLTDLFVDEISAVASPAIAGRLRSEGLQHLHDFLEPDQVVDLLARLDRKARAVAVPLSRALVEATTPSPPPPYFICARTWIRTMIPYRSLESSPHILEAGHLHGHVLPVGPHSDFWLTHPRATISMWSAVGPVREGNTISLFDFPDQHSAPRNYVAGPSVVPESSLGPAIKPALEPGDVLLFNADRLHASVRNETDETRVAVGTRVVLGRSLHYGPGTHWRPWYDARLLDTRLAWLASARSRLTRAALRRWRWQRQYRRTTAGH